jgi:hypothetical protein
MDGGRQQNIYGRWLACSPVITLVFAGAPNPTINDPQRPFVRTVEESNGRPFILSLCTVTQSDEEIKPRSPVLYGIIP